MLTVYKYPIPIDDEFRLELPEGARILHVGVQGEAVNVWALVDPNERKCIRHFRMAGTGHSIDESLKLAFVGTVMLSGGRLVFHLFEVTG